jgi:hypothetical protein
VTNPPDLAEFLRIIDGHDPARVKALLAAMEATLAAHGFDFSHISDDELLAEVTRRLLQSPAPVDAPTTDSSSA